MPSNIRRRNQDQEEHDDYLDHDFMKGRDYKRMEQRQDDPPEEAPHPFAGHPLIHIWDNYRIKPTIPEEDIIEILILRERLTNAEIALLLGKSEYDLTHVVQNLENDWRKLGQPMSAEDKELERGRQIRHLERLIIDLDMAYADTRAPALLSQKLNALKEITVLRNLMAEKNATKDEEDEDDFTSVIDGLSAEKLLELRSHSQKSELQ